MKGNRTMSSNHKKQAAEICQRYLQQQPSIAPPTISDNRNNDRNPLLEALLPKLRPFQREAFDLATQGKATHNRQSSKLPGKTTIAASSTIIEEESPNFGKGRILLADEMGLGKTVTSLAIMTFYRQEWPLLILCPASLRYTWPAEIEKFLPSMSPRSVYVVSGYDDADFYDNPVKRHDIQIVVATYSLLQKRSAAARVLEQYEFQCIIADESHNLKQKNSQRCQLALPLLQRAKRLVLLSGTPALARPVELWPQAYSLAPALFGNYNIYTQRYCNARRGRFGWDVSGISNANELHLKLQQVMIRRLKSQVLHELPSKQRTIVPVSIDRSNVKECREVMDALRQARLDVNNFSEYLGGNTNVEEDDKSRSAHWEARKLLMQAYQVGGVGKAAAVAEYVLDWLSGSTNTQKILVFAHHKAVLDIIELALSKEYKGVAHIRIDGQVTPHDRAQRVRKFQTNPQVRVALLSVTAAGVGLTLTAASTVVMAELHWTPGVLAQAEDRCHRLGQANAVQILYLICKDSDLSVDMQLWQMVARKVNNLGLVMDGSKGSFLTQDGTKGSEGTKATSVQDDISSFFANEASNQRHQRNEVPVKGTILSFFQKVGTSASNNEKPLSSKSNQTTSNGMSRSVNSIGHRISQIDVAPSIENMTTPAENSVAWSCEMCTFDNTEVRRASGWLACAMCSSPYVEPIRKSQSEILPVTPGKESLEQKPIDTLQTDIIAIDDESISEQGNETVSDDIESQQESTTIVIDDYQQAVVTPAGDRRRIKSDHVPFLSFSVSENSGRVIIHFAENGESANVNFQIEEILSKQAAERLLETSVKRSRQVSKATLNKETDFDDHELKRVILKLDRSKQITCILCEEVKTFVLSYLSLREVEKKALMKSGACYVGDGLHQAAAKLMAAPIAAYCSDRYIGGAKERAKERLQAGTATDIDIAVLGGEACAWCAGPLSTASKKSADIVSTYCSRECSENGRLRRGGMYGSKNVRDQVFAMEGGICSKCGIDAHAMYLRMRSLHPAERLNALCNSNWKLPKGRQALERLLQDPKEGDFWQADHIQAVVEGGGDCGLENLRTLCTPCHQEETRLLLSRIRLNGGSLPASKQKQQRDIRDVLGCQSQHKRPRLSEESDQTMQVSK